MGVFVTGCFVNEDVKKLFAPREGLSAARVSQPRIRKKPSMLVFLRPAVSVINRSSVIDKPDQERPGLV